VVSDVLWCSVCAECVSVTFVSCAAKMMVDTKHPAQRLLCAHRELQLHPTTYFLAMTVFRRSSTKLLSEERGMQGGAKQTRKRERDRRAFLRKLAFVSSFVASKVNEVRLPTVSTYLQRIDDDSDGVRRRNKCSPEERDDFLRLEMTVLDVLEWDLHQPTALSFMQAHISRLEEGDVHMDGATTDGSMKRERRETRWEKNKATRDKLREVATTHLETAQARDDLVARFDPSILALAAIIIAAFVCVREHKSDDSSASFGASFEAVLKVDFESDASPLSRREMSALASSHLSSSTSAVSCSPSRPSPRSRRLLVASSARPDSSTRLDDYDAVISEAKLCAISMVRGRVDIPVVKDEDVASERRKRKRGQWNDDDNDEDDDKENRHPPQ